MTSLIVTPLRKMYDKAVSDLNKHSLSESDIYVIEVMKLYNPKIVTDEITALIENELL